MDEINTRDLSSSSDSEDEKPSSVRGKVYRLFGRERPVHMVLGGGKSTFLCFALIPPSPPPLGAADVLLWRDKKVTGGMMGVATAMWILFEVLEYHFVSLICHALILASLFLFFWSNAANFLSRSLPEIPQISIPEWPVVKLSHDVRMVMNRSFFFLREIASGRDLKKFLVTIGGLWIVSVAGRYCDFLTVLYAVMVVAFSVPRFYEKYEDQVDAFGEKAAAELEKQYAVFEAKVLSKIPILKDKKMA